MKTLKELYEIVKAAGGDFPFEAYHSGDGNCTILSIGEIAFFYRINYEDNFPLEQVWYFDGNNGTSDYPDWQFPEDSPYLEPTWPCGPFLIGPSQRGMSFVDEDKIESNRQRWEDLGKPWGRLKTYTPMRHPMIEGEIQLLEFDNKTGGCFVIMKEQDNKREFVDPANLELPDKTLLHLDDWLSPTIDEQIDENRRKIQEMCEVPMPASTNTTTYVKETCEFCKGKEELTWDIGSMPCPYCQPERFQCND